MPAELPTYIHIINPFFAYPGTDSYFSQQLTFNTLRYARIFSNQQPSVQLATAQFSEDRRFIPSHFHRTADLTRSVLDFNHFHPLRKFPLLSDILQRAYEEFSSDFVIYSNADISVQPHFYRILAWINRTNPGSFTITRRTLTHSYYLYSELPEMYLDAGEPHRGWDCFILPRQLIPRLNLGEICLGAPLVGLALHANLQSLDTHFTEYRYLHLTFHLGNDRRWSHARYSEYFRHNQNQLLSILDELENTHGQFLPTSPAGRYKQVHRSRWLGRIYDFLTTRIHIPARITRRSG